MLSRNWVELKENTSSTECHIWPCLIKYSGPVDKSKFEIQLSGTPSARLRGRPLKGRQLDLISHGFSGFEISLPTQKAEVDDAEFEVASPTSPAEIESCAISATEMVQTGPPFGKIIVWEHGKVPGNSDPWASKLEELLAFARSVS